MSRIALLGVFGAVLLLAGIKGSQGNPPATTEAAETPGFLGIAARYPGDVGIEHDPAVVFSDNFEISNVSDLSSRWTQVDNKDSYVMLMVQGYHRTHTW